MKTNVVLSMVVLLFIITACSQKEPPATAALEVDFKWNPPCTSLRRSPQIMVNGVPQETKRFFVALTDLDLPSFDHGNGFADYDGTTLIKPGAVIGSYKDPSPPHGVIHRYEIRVEARNSDNDTIGIGKKIKIYPPKGEEEMRWVPCK